MATEDEIAEEEFEGFNEDADNNHGNKRKADNEPTENKTGKSKKRKRRRITDENSFDEVHALNLAIGDMDSRLLVDHIAQKTKRFEPKLSIVETADRYIPQEAVMDTSAFDESRATARLPVFLRKFAGPDLSYAPEENGSPHMLVVTGAALRAADLARLLRTFQAKDAKVGKLFAKHIKLGEAKEFCEKNRYAPFLNLDRSGLHSGSMSLGVGTPQRITDLLEDGTLSSKHLRHIVIDASHVDQKKRGIFDMRETHLPLVRLLTRSEFKKRYEAAEEVEKVKILFF